MARSTKFAALIMGLAVSACGGAGNGLTPSHNPSLYSANQPVVQRTDYVLDLSGSGSGVSAGERGRLAAWFDSIGIAYGDKIFVEEAYGYAGSASRADIARVASDYGLLLSDGAPVTAGQVQPGSVRVIVSRSSASVPDCPNWQSQTGGKITTASNYGCAVNSNLAAMIADPNDLVLGQTGSRDGNPDAATKAIKVYRNAVPTGSQGLQTQTPGGGK